MLTERLDYFLNNETSKIGIRNAKMLKSKEKTLYRQRKKS